MATDTKLEMFNITKTFPGVKALDEVSLVAGKGEIVGIVGVNGAGKSTLMNVLGGLVHPDDGEIHIDGKKVTISSPKIAEQNGISFIHQELLSFFTLTVAENVFISHLFKNKRLPFLLNKRAAVEEARKYLNMLGSSVDPKKKIADIPVGERQVVEIARAVAMGSEIIIFDEPTSSLSLHEKDNLFDVIRKLKIEGKTILYITHFLDEISLLTERFIVLRNGKVNGRGTTKDVTKNDITKMIIGKEIEYSKRIERKVEDKLVLKVENISSGSMIKNVDLNLYSGEILGIWGLMGSGRTELMRAMLGLDKVESGSIYLKEKNILVKIQPKILLRHCGYITENRHSNGLFLTESICKNITATSLNKYSYSVFNVLDRRKEIEDTNEYIGLLKISTPGPKTKMESLSGGNQQKVVFSKWLNKKAKIFIMDEPTRGVDVGAKLEIHNLIRKLAIEGTSIILISSEIEEIVVLSDRVLVLKDGCVVKSLDGNKINNTDLMTLSLGVTTLDE